MVGADMAGQSGWGFAFVNGSGYIRQTSMNALTFVKQTDYDTKITELETAISNLSSTLSTVSSNLNAHRHYYYDYKGVITGDVKRTSSDRYGNF